MGDDTKALVAYLPPGEMMRQATDVAGACGAIVKATVSNIQGKRYVRVEGWQAIAIAHGCVASSGDVRRAENGYVATGEIRRASDGVVICRAEGFVGLDEKKWGSAPEYACRAMAQTRAISRACRSAFAHVVIMIDSNLSTTPAEEVPDGGFSDAPAQRRSTTEVTTGGGTGAKAEPSKRVTPVQRRELWDLARERFKDDEAIGAFIRARTGKSDTREILQPDAIALIEEVRKLPAYSPPAEATSAVTDSASREPGAEG